MPQDNDDALSRRDMGLEFLNVTAQVHASRIESRRHGGSQVDVYRLTNNSTSIVDTHLLVIARGLPRQVQLENGSGVTSTGDPYLRVFLPQGALQPGQSIVQTLVFKRRHGGRDHDESAAAANYRLDLLSGQGNP